MRKEQVECVSDPSVLRTVPPVGGMLVAGGLCRRVLVRDGASFGAGKAPRTPARASDRLVSSARSRKAAIQAAGQLARFPTAATPGSEAGRLGMARRLLRCRRRRGRRHLLRASARSRKAAIQAAGQLARFPTAATPGSEAGRLGMARRLLRCRRRRGRRHLLRASARSRKAAIQAAGQLARFPTAATPGSEAGRLGMAHLGCAIAEPSSPGPWMARRALKSVLHRRPVFVEVELRAVVQVVALEAVVHRPLLPLRRRQREHQILP